MSDTHGISERPEDLSIRRAMDRSEDPKTLEEQLHTGLEDTFPASDPVAVSSPTISGQAPKLVGTEEILARKQAARAALVNQRAKERRRAERLEASAQAVAMGGIIAGVAIAIGAGLWLAHLRRVQPRRVPGTKHLRMPFRNG